MDDDREMHRPGGYSFPTTGARILFDPMVGETAGVGGTATGEDDGLEGLGTAEPGLTSEQLAERPSPAGIDANDAGSGSGGGTLTPADPNMAAQAGLAPAPAAAQQAQTIRDAARAYGLDLSQYQDDHAAFVALVQQAQASRHNDYYAQLGRQIAPHHQQVREYLATQQQRQQAPAERPTWQPPDFDERWLTVVDKDPNTGMFVAKPGYDPSIAERVNQYADWMAGFNRNPMAVIGPAIQHEATRIAQEIVGQQFGRHQEQQTIGSIIESNAAWLYQADANGSRYVDQNGKYIPTPLGSRYVQHIQTLSQAGVRDVRALDTLARQLLQGEAQQQQVAAANRTAQTQTPQARAALGHPAVNAGQAVPPTRLGAVAGATEPSGEGLSLAEQLRQALAAEGISDSDFASLGG